MCALGVHCAIGNKAMCALGGQWAMIVHWWVGSDCMYTVCALGVHCAIGNKAMCALGGQRAMSVNWVYTVHCAISCRTIEKRQYARYAAQYGKCMTIGNVQGMRCAVSCS